PRQAQGVVLHILDGSDEAPFLGIPRGKHDRPLRADSSLQLFGDGPRCFEYTHRSAHVVGRAWTPAVSMSTDDDHLVGELGPAHDSERVVDRLQRSRRAIVAYGHSSAHRTGANVVVKGKSALPALGNVTASHESE